MLASFVTGLVLAAPGVLGRPPSPNSVGNHSDYETLQGLFHSANSLAVSLVENQSGACTSANLKVRREWDVLSTEEKNNYISAVLCLQSSPALTPSYLGSGIKTRFDDFIATHMNQTLTIHYTGNFLTWHRYYIWLFEQALRDECGYTGTLAYWNWPKTAITGLHNSPVFDGSQTSMSGDGAFIANKSDINCAAGSPVAPFWVPAGSGGGCVTNGPFVNYTLNLGPVSLAVPGGAVETNPFNDTGIFSWNPRCLKRDLTDYINQNFANATSVLTDALNWDSIADFQLIFQGEPASLMEGGTTIGVHGGGHFSMGGDPGRDLYVSPGDPAFYLHHTMMDRVYWLWQMQDPESRVFGNNVVAGTNTFMNNPPSANTTVEDYVQYNYAAGPPRQINELLSTTAGPFCYVYE